jgi:hypothetical protein
MFIDYADLGGEVVIVDVLRKVSTGVACYTVSDLWPVSREGRATDPNHLLSLRQASLMRLLKTFWLPRKYDTLTTFREIPLKKLPRGCRGWSAVL